MPESRTPTPAPEEGQSFIEYGLLLSLIALVGMTFVTALNGKVPGVLLAAVLQ
jgi:Flp pilus assembly pilin Flp